MELLNKLWSSNIRAEANYSIDASSQEISDYCSHNNIRFLIIFKKGHTGSNHKVL